MKVVGALVLCALTALVTAVPLNENPADKPLPQLDPKPAVLPAVDPIPAVLPAVDPKPAVLPAVDPKPAVLPAVDPKPAVLPAVDPKPAVLPAVDPKPAVLPVDLKPTEPCKATCRKTCQYGFLENENCPRCTCAPNPCDTADCADNTVCITEPSTCEGGSCPHVASCMGLGLIMSTPDVDKKAVLPVDPKPDVLPVDPKPAVLPVDPKPAEPCKATCRKTCQYGFLENENCPRCTCAPNPCDTANCADNNVCITKPSLCLGGSCPHVAECKGLGLILPKPGGKKKGPCEATAKKFCPYGFKSRGCPRSKCAPDPCFRKKCRKGKLCISKPKPCPFKTGCPHKASCVKGPVAMP